jgi:hypothetical protein
VAISDKVRKQLWGRAGSRCALCNAALTELDGVAVIIGDEAHIRSARPEGPRFDADFPVTKIDAYENMVLLCKAHHKLVDDNAEVFPVEFLTGIKARHEARVRRALDPEKTGWACPPDLIVVEDGTQLMSILSQVMASLHSNVHPKTDEERDAIASFLQNASDWSEIAEEIGPSGRVQAAADLHEELVELESLGLVVIAGVGQYWVRPDVAMPTVFIRVERRQA